MEAEGSAEKLAAEEAALIIAEVEKARIETGEAARLTTEEAADTSAVE